MDGVNVVCFMWGSKYGIYDVERLARYVKKRMRTPHRFHLFTDLPYQSLPEIEVHQIEDRQLMDRSCFCRLRVFDPEWQKKHGLTGQILCLDLDLLIVGLIDDLLATPSTFKILQGVNAVNPNPFNCSVMLLRAGHHGEVWSDFSLEKARAARFHEFPDDQGWIWHKLPNADGWRAGAESGIYGFQKPGWPYGSAACPRDAKIIAFIGARKPTMYTGIKWIRDYWSGQA